MVRFSNIILTYLVIGGVMFGGGAIGWTDIGAAQFFVDGEPGNLDGSEESKEQVGSVGSSISNLADLAVGPIVFVFNLAVNLVVYLNWPLTVLIDNNAPPSAVLLIGVPLTAAFYLSIIRLVKTSA